MATDCCCLSCLFHPHELIKAFCSNRSPLARDFSYDQYYLFPPPKDLAASNKQEIDSSLEPLLGFREQMELLEKELEAYNQEHTSLRRFLGIETKKEEFKPTKMDIEDEDDYAQYCRERDIEEIRLLVEDVTELKRWREIEAEFAELAQEEVIWGETEAYKRDTITIALQEELTRIDAELIELQQPMMGVKEESTKNEDEEEFGFRNVYYGRKGKKMKKRDNAKRHKALRLR